MNNYNLNKASRKSKNKIKMISNIYSLNKYQKIFKMNKIKHSLNNNNKISQKNKKIYRRKKEEKQIINKTQLMVPLQQVKQLLIFKNEKMKVMIS